MKVFESVIELTNGDIKKVTIADTCKQNAIKQINANCSFDNIIKIQDITKKVFNDSIGNELAKYSDFLTSNKNYSLAEHEILIAIFREFLEKRNKE